MKRPTQAQNTEGFRAHHMKVFAAAEIPHQSVRRIKMDGDGERHFSLKPILDLPSQAPPWSRALELYWLTAAMDCAGLPFPRWVWRYMPGAALMPTLPLEIARYLFRGMPEKDALFLVLRGVRVEGIRTSLLTNFYSEEDGFDPPADIAAIISAKGRDYAKAEEQRMPGAIRDVFDAVLVGLVVAGQCSWPIAGPLTRHFLRMWTKARVSAESAARILLGLHVSVFDLISAGAHIHGATQSDLASFILSRQGSQTIDVRVQQYNWLADHLGQMARSQVSQDAAESHSGEMAYVLEIGDTYQDKRISVSSLLNSVDLAQEYADLAKKRKAEVVRHRAAIKAKNVEERIRPAVIPAPQHDSQQPSLALPAVFSEAPSTTSTVRAKFRPGVREITPKARKNPN